MDYINRKWVIVNVSDITDEMIGSAMQLSVDTLRKTNDGSKAILKFDGNTPGCFKDLDLYNHSEILTILKESDWTEEED